jgi:hypothetical protein
VAPRGIRVERRARLADSRFVATILYMHELCLSVICSTKLNLSVLSSDHVMNEFENTSAVQPLNHVFSYSRASSPLYAPSPACAHSQ